MAGKSLDDLVEDGTLKENEPMDLFSRKGWRTLSQKMAKLSRFGGERLQRRAGVDEHVEEGELGVLERGDFEGRIGLEGGAKGH